MVHAVPTLRASGPKNEFKREGERWTRFTAYKGHNRFPVEMEARLTPELIDALEKTEIGTDSYVLSARGTPYTIEYYRELRKRLLPLMWGGGFAALLVPRLA
ncbi:hypothetical protein HGP16_26505 [Rhizobium sp. P40RR-XXII]|uniref:hypothetical protein n=1 Tax=Rhizobium sp. P40RR-XXII TaxID=2726739 RepID=UPI001456B69A|nr:hypothetical protein [Rhizobium sp. P40RR-XXII]NLS20091.1 hypothetical protein [Rhizobium sp. P40RR-XXII]